MSEIKLSDHIRNSLREARTSRKIKGATICKSLEKHPSFISHIENGVVKTVDSEDLKDVFRYILEIDDEHLDKYIDELINTVNRKAPTRSSQPPDYQKLYEERQEEQIEMLHEIVQQIQEEMSYYPPDYEDCEEEPIFEDTDKFLTTLINLMLDSESEILRKFYSLMKLPLFKLNPVQFQELIDYAENLLEYEYVFESGERESYKTQSTPKYPHYRVKYKETTPAQK